MKLGFSAETLGGGLAGRLAWMTALRLVFLALFLSATAFFYVRGDFSPVSSVVRVALVTIALSFALAAVYAAVLRGERHLRELADAQLVVDQILWTGIVYVSGGATSGAVSFYALTALVGAILTGLRGATIATVAGIAVYGLLCAAFHFQWLSAPDDSPSPYVTDGPGLLYSVLVNTLGIIVVALLGGYLAERLRITGGALEAAQERAATAERLAELGRLAAGLAHEIRNPLGSISGSVEMLRESAALSEDEKRLCDIISREASRLNNLVSDMVNLAKPRPPRAESVDVAALATEVVALASRSDRAAGDVTVVYEGPASQVRARCDAAQMRQVLWNLVRNAVQVSAAAARVVVHVERRGDEIEIEVRDQGPGIAPGDRARIFDAYFSKRSQGTGIGLAVVKRIIDDHAGMGARIDVESAQGKGATFRVLLRAERDASSPALAVEPAA